MSKYERLARLVKFMALLKANKQSLIEEPPEGCIVSRRKNRRGIESSDELGTRFWSGSR